MAINRFRKRISIYARTYAKDGMGGSTESNALVKEAWARIENLSGRRLEDVGLLINTSPVVITIRALSYEIDTNNYIVYGSNTYVIHSVATDETNRFTKIIAYIDNARN